MIPFALVNLLLTLVLLLVMVQRGVGPESRIGFVLFSLSVVGLLLVVSASWLWRHNVAGRWLKDAYEAFGDGRVPYVSPMLQRVVRVASLLAMMWTLTAAGAMFIWFAHDPLAPLCAIGVVLAGGGVCMLGFDWLSQQSLVREAAHIGRSMKHPPSAS